MGNSFKFIHLVTIIVVIMIVVTMGLFIMLKSQEFVSNVELTKYDVGEFNGLWMSYEGLHKGSKLKGLFMKLKINAEENRNCPEKLIDVAYNTTGGSDFKIIKSTSKNPNVEAFQQAQNEIIPKHAYIVEFIYNEKKDLIIGILIKNHRNDKVEFVPDQT